MPPGDGSGEGGRRGYWFRVKAYLRDDTWTNDLATVDLIVT
jgi:hypothetical protein